MIDILGLLFAMLATALIVSFWVWARRAAAPPALREVDAYEDLPQKAGEAVESGKRIHVSVGAAPLGGESTTIVLAGITVLEAAAAGATISDKPPIVTAGDSTSMLLAQDSMRRIYHQQNASEQYDHHASRLAGVSTYSNAAGVMTLLKDEAVSTSLLVGSFGNEVALMADAGWQQGAHQIIGTDNVQAQAAAYVTADHALIGEDVYASGAYLGGGKLAHRASLQAQDVLRVMIVLGILFAVFRKILLGSP